MSDNNLVASISIDYLDATAGPAGAGHYYQISDPDGEKSEQVGPFETVAAAEQAAEDAIKLMLTNMVRQNLGMD